MTGTLLSADQAFNEYGIKVKDFTTALSKENVRSALAERGVVFERLNEDFTAYALTPTQLLVANSLLDLTDTRSNKKKLQDLGIATITYNAWLKDPIFRDYLAKRANQMIGDNVHEVDLALLDKIRAGDLKAIEYYNEMTGRFVRAKAGQNVDVMGIITRIIEIIDEEVEDPATLERLALRIRGAVSARSMAMALTGNSPVGDDDIIVPQVVKALPLETDSDNDDEHPRATGL